MVAPTYLTSCPGCGRPLQPVALGSETPPWLCGPDGCGHGFWVCELSEDGRRAYEPRLRSWKSWAHPMLTAGRDQEHAAARKRGTSARPEHLPLLPAVTLRHLAAVAGLEPGFAAQVADAARVCEDR